MNLPIDPREGNRRQKALQARLAAMAQNRKAFVGKVGQERGRVRSMGAIGGARGARFPGNGAARPGALSFLQAPGYGMRAIDGTSVGRGQGPEMIPSSPFGPLRHVSNPLPTQALPGQPGSTVPGIPNYTVPAQDPGVGPAPVPDWAQQAQAQGKQVIDYGPKADDGPRLIPLGGGQWFDPSTGQIHGTGGGTQNFKAL